MLACASGEHIKKAVLTCRKAGKDQQEFLKYHLQRPAGFVLSRPVGRLTATIDSDRSDLAQLRQDRAGVQGAEAGWHAGRRRQGRVGREAEREGLSLDVSGATMNAQELFQAGKLDEAVQALGAELRDNPADAKRRTFLFELLCFAGEYHAPKSSSTCWRRTDARRKWARCCTGPRCTPSGSARRFSRRRITRSPEPDSDAPISGTLNGKPFTFFSDADPRLGARLEVFAAGDYLWIPLRAHRVD